MQLSSRFRHLRQSLFGQLTMAFCWLGAMFLLLTGVIHLFRTSRTVEAQMTASGTELIDQTDGTLNQTMDSLSVLLNSTLMQTNVLRLALSPDLREFENIKSVTDALTDAVASSPLVDAAYLYSPKADLGMSSDYRLSNYQDDAYRSVLARFDTRKNKLRPYLRGDCATYFYTENNDVYLIQGFADVRYDRCSCFILFHLNTEQLGSMVNYTKDDSLRFYNRSGLRMFSEADPENDPVLLDAVAEQPAEKGNFLCSTGRGRYARIFFSRNSYLGWTAVYLVNSGSSPLLQFMNSTPLFIGVITLFLLSLTCFMIFSARRISRPFSDLVERLKGSGGLSDSSQSDWEYLASTYSHLLDQNRELEHYLPLAADEIHGQLFRTLMNGGSIDRGETERQLKLIGSSFRFTAPTEAVLLSFSFTQNEDDDALARQLTELNLKNTVDLLPELSRIPHYFIQPEENILCLICQFPETSGEDAEKLHAALSGLRFEKGSVTWGFGSIVPDLESLTESVLTAQSALYFDPQKEETGGSAPEQEREMTAPYVDAFRKLLDITVQAGAARPEEDAAELLQRAAREVGDPHKLRHIFRLFLEILDSRMKSLKISDTEAAAPLDTDSEEITSEELLRDVREKCIRSFRLIRSQVTTGQEQYVARVLSYISENYADVNVSLESAADSVGIHPTYLSRLFKNVTGQNFINCLNEYRVRKAEKLLETSGLPAQEIGFLTGFYSAATFFRVFKKYTGMTPIQYRKSRQGASA